MKNQNYIGIDVSKNTLDCCVLQNKNKSVVFKSTIENSIKGLKSFAKELKTHKINMSKTLICCESTGLYNYALLIWAGQRSYKLWQENPLAIKRSMGLVRGKNDQIDAFRIALYACRFEDQCRLWKAPRPVVQQLGKLVSRRKKLIKIKGQISRTIQEERAVMGTKACKGNNSFSSTLKGIQKDLSDVEQAIKCCIASDDRISRLHEVITSVDGIGPVTANELIVETNEFLTIDSPKKLACYVGVAPFQHTSGTSIRGRSRTSSLASKGLKTLLHLGAVSSIRTSEETKAYFERKVAEGKHVMSVLNAIRNKMIHKVYACVRDDRLYQKTYTKKLA